MPTDPQRIVSVGYNDQDTILALGGTLAGTFDWYGDYPYGVWPWAQDLLGDAQPEIVGTASTNIDFEKVAAVAPDLVVGTYSGLTQAQYDKLSAIAPTVAQPADFADYGVPWQDQTRILGDALGKKDKAAELVSSVETQFDDVRAANRRSRERPSSSARSRVRGSSVCTARRTRRSASSPNSAS